MTYKKNRNWTAEHVGVGARLEIDAPQIYRSSNMVSTEGMVVGCLTCTFLKTNVRAISETKLDFHFNVTAALLEMIR